jgi:hypothetical protein
VTEREQAGQIARRPELTAGTGNVRGRQLDGTVAARGVEDRTHDVGDKVGLLAMHEVPGGVSDDCCADSRHAHSRWNPSRMWSASARVSGSYHGIVQFSDRASVF